MEENLKTDLIELMKKYNFESIETNEEHEMFFRGYENDDYLGSINISLSIN